MVFFMNLFPWILMELLNKRIIPLSEVKIISIMPVSLRLMQVYGDIKLEIPLRFTSINPYRIKVSGRTKHHINVFGEELIIENAEDALKKVCKKTNAEIVEYTAAPIFMQGKEKGAHEWLIEFKTQPNNIDYFNELFDNALKSLNSDYEAKRFNNITLNKPTIHLHVSNFSMIG